MNARKDLAHSSNPEQAGQDRTRNESFPSPIAQTLTSETKAPIGVGDFQPRRLAQTARAAVAIVPERRWAIDCTDPKLRDGLRERFERLVACAVEVELGRKYDHQSQATDDWLDLMKREGRYGHAWKIGLLLTLSAERCKELRLRALKDRNSWAAEIFREIDGELRILLAENPRDELYAIDERAGETPTVDAPKPGNPDAGDSRTLTQWNVCAANRRGRVDAAIEEVWKVTGKRISRADIWRLARYKYRTEFERWESCWYEKRGKNGNVSAHARFTKILDEKLYLTIFPAIHRISPPCALLGGEPNNSVGGAR